MKPGKRQSRAADLPGELPLLPLFDHVLLPGGFVRVHIPASWRKSTALVQHLLQQQGGEVLVAAVPYMTGSDEGSPGAGQGEEAPLDETLDWSRLHAIGTAARVVQLLRRTQVRCLCGWVACGRLCEACPELLGGLLCPAAAAQQAGWLAHLTACCCALLGCHGPVSDCRRVAGR